MQRTATLITIALFLAGTGVVGAQPTTNCAEPQDEAEIVEGVSVPMSDDRYFYVPTTELAGSAADKAQEKFGVWEEENFREGLQTEPCFKFGVIRMFEPDTHLGAVVP